ncbi:MAG: HupE/UreJ family protein [Xanthobacteraceae bacterium]
MKRAISILAAASVLTPVAALAHTGAGHAHGVVHGLMHPISGLDHVLAMVAVGMLAAMLGGRAIWLVPASFVALAAVGGVLGMQGVPVPFVEFGISASVVLLGLAIALQAKLPLGWTAGLVGLFGLYHGFAHGAEMPADASGLAYGVGFLAATAMLHIAGIGLGLGIAQLAKSSATRFAQAGGTAIALAGVALLAHGL